MPPLLPCIFTSIPTIKSKYCQYEDTRQLDDVMTVTNAVLLEAFYPNWLLPTIEKLDISKICCIQHPNPKSPSGLKPPCWCFTRTGWITSAATSPQPNFAESQNPQTVSIRPQTRNSPPSLQYIMQCKAIADRHLTVHGHLLFEQVVHDYCLVCCMKLEHCA